MSLIGRGARRACILVARLIGPLFFSRKHLTGRHFGPTSQGWMWVWRSIWTQRIAGVNRACRFPVSPLVRVQDPDHLQFHPDDLNNFQSFGCYFQNQHGRIRIGRGTYIAPNVGMITSNHDPLDLDRHLPARDVSIGERCWIGMNAVILPGVVLGDQTIVAAGAVVTRSFPGNCIVGGVPARILRASLEPKEESAA